MSNTNSSPNMNLPVPVVLTDPGPDYATNINLCLTLVDSHNHTSGYGVQIPPGGLNINADLPFGTNNATLLRSVRFVAQASPLALGTDIGCCYVSGVDLYFNDVNGNQVRITQSGGVAGSPGSISNLTSPASASYVAGSSTFVWQSNSNTPANLDAGSVILRNITVNSKGLTLNPPSSMAASYSLTLPALPAGQQIMTLDASGNITAPYTVDNSTIAITTNVIGVKSGGITTSQIASSTIKQSNMAILSPTSPVSLGSSSTTSTSPVTIGSASITTTGGAVMILLYGQSIYAGCTSNQLGGRGQFVLFRDGSQINYSYVGGESAAPGLAFTVVTSPGSLNFVDRAPSAGSHTYTLKYSAVDSGATVGYESLQMMLVEL